MENPGLYIHEEEHLMLRRATALMMLAVLTVSATGCNWVQLSRWQDQTGIELTPEEKRDLIDLPDYMADNCIWSETGLRARGFNEDALKYNQLYGLRESRCCPNVVGGNKTDDFCAVVGSFSGMDPTDTGYLQFNGYRPSGGTVDGTPARGFCTDGVRRFREGKWTDEITYPCNQWEVLADPELQLDMVYDLVIRCGFGSWQPTGKGKNKKYPCKSSYVGIVTAEPFMTP